MTGKTTLAAISASFYIATALTHSALSKTAGTWTTGASMPGASYGQLGAFVGGRFYAISGFATNRVGIYDPVNNSWTTGAPLPQFPPDSGYNLRQFYGCAVVGTKIYVIGGDTGGTGARDTNYEYDTASNTWANRAVIPGGARSFLVAVNLNNKIYAIGGIDASGQYSSRVDIYDPSSNTWSSGTPLPAARIGMVAGTINGKIYLAGGSAASGTLTSALVFDPNNPESWTSIAAMPIAGNGHSAVLNNQLFVLGSGTSANQVQSYDSNSNTWNTNYALLPVGRADDGAVAADQASGKLYDAGGYNDGQFLDRLDILSLNTGPPVITSPLNLDYLSTNEILDPTTNTWSAKTRMPTAREGFGLAAASGGQDGNWTVEAPMPGPGYALRAAFVNGKVYAISGFSVDSSEWRLNRIYDPANNTWTLGTPLPDLGDGYPLRQFFGCAAVGTKIYVIGGDTGGTGFRNTNFEYDTVANSWTTKAVLPGDPRSGLAAVNLNGKVYVIGGYLLDNGTSTHVDIYDPSNDTWSSGTPLPSGRAEAAAAVVNGKIYLAAGNDSTGSLLSTALVFDPANPTAWQPIAPLPIVGNASGQSVSLDGKFFIIGCGSGVTQDNTVQAYDPVSNTWSTNYSLLPTARANGAAAVDEGSAKIYYMGGDVSATGFLSELDVLSIAPAPEKIYVAGGEVTACPGPPVATLEAYSPDTDSWVTLGPMPTARKNLSPGTVNDGVNDVIYFIGGQTECSGTVGNVEAYDVGTKIWTEKQAMTFPRSQTGVGVLNGKVYAVGGSDANGEPQTTLEVYDPSANAWTTLAPMPTARIAPAIGVVNNVLYAIGGYDNVNLNGDQQVEAFDPSTGNWTAGLALLPTPRTSGTGVGVVNNLIHVFGGVNNDHEVSIDETYDPVSNTWSIAPPMPTARFGLGGVVTNNSLYALGGVLKGIATVGRPFVYQIAATNQPSSYGASGLPDGLRIDSTLGIISGIPTTPSYNSQVQLKAMNGAGLGSATLAFSVQDAISFGPTLVNSTSATGKSGQSFSFKVLASNTNSRGLFTAGGLPPGLTIDSGSGVISGVPTADGNFAVSLSITDQNTTSNSNLQLNFVSDLAVPIITSADTALLVPGQPFTYTITADTDGRFSYIGTDGVVNGVLPSGLSFHPPATISGTYNGGSADGNRSNTMFSAPDTIKIRPPPLSVIQPLASNSHGTGTRPLNFYVPTAVSRKTHGTAGNFDISLPLTGDPGIECRTGGANGTYQVVVGFPTGVTLSGATVTPGTGGTASLAGPPILSRDGTQVTINLATVSDVQILTVTLTGVNDGTNTYDVAVPMGVLIGDTGANGIVDLPDGRLVKSQYGKRLTTSNCREDVNADGSIDPSDLSLMKSYAGTKLP
ncbi:MAG TPA: kelch repeat-containing protein [Chthoniobacterales bacterium]|jgi:N-acetylneuraminic acid mutarotase